MVRLKLLASGIKTRLGDLSGNGPEVSTTKVSTAGLRGIALRSRALIDQRTRRRAVAPGSYGRDSHFSLEPMLSYKLNPFTVFFLGANIGGSDDPYPNRDGLSLTGQTVYAKYQYLWRAF